MSQHIQAFRAQIPPDNTTSHNSSRQTSSSSSPAVLLLKGQLEQHALHVVDIVQYRAAALQRQAAAASSPSHKTHAATGALQPPQQGAEGTSPGSPQRTLRVLEPVKASPHAAMLQQALVQRSQRVEADKQVLVGAAEWAVRLMEQQVVALEAQGWSNAYLAGKRVEVRASSENDSAIATPSDWLASACVTHHSWMLQQLDQKVARTPEVCGVCAMAATSETHDASVCCYSSCY